MSERVGESEREREGVGRDGNKHVPLSRVQMAICRSSILEEAVSICSKIERKE